MHIKIIIIFSHINQDNLKEPINKPMFQPQPPLVLSPSQTSSNQNSQYGITPQLQLSLANGNTQFAIDISKLLNISYTIPTIALQITNKFFHLRCYIHYDRFMIILASILLACKLKYMEIRIKKIVFVFHQVIGYRCQLNDLINQAGIDRIKDEICVAENQILRTLGYEIDVITGHEYLSVVMGVSGMKGRERDREREERIKLTTRVIILDSNRTQCSLFFSPLVICVASFMIACRYEGVKPYENIGQIRQVSAHSAHSVQSAQSGQNGQNGYNKPTDTSFKDRNQEQMYSQWLELICRDQVEKLKPEDITKCIKHMNQLFNMIVA